jgi:hypothetical protein
MKKILAIAVATAIAAPAMADMTIGGTVAVGYQAVDSADSGFGVDTAALSISGKTEVNGVAIAANMNVGGLARDAGVAGENASLVASGDFGSVLVGALEIGSGIRGLGQAGAPVNNMEGEILGAAVNLDIVKYTTPAMGPVKGYIIQAGGTGLATGDTGAVYVYGATGNLAGVTFAADYSDFTSNNTDRTRVSAKYTAGAVTVGAGYETRDYVTYDRVQTIMGLNYAASDALNVGAVYTTTDDQTTTRNGYSVGLSNNLGGGVSVSANYASWEGTTADDNKTTVLVAYSF